MGFQYTHMFLIFIRVPEWHSLQKSAASYRLPERKGLYQSVRPFSFLFKKEKGGIIAEVSRLSKGESPRQVISLEPNTRAKALYSYLQLIFMQNTPISAVTDDI